MVQCSHLTILTLPQSHVTDNSGTAITCSETSSVALNNSRMERNGIDAILKQERSDQTKEDVVMAETTPALIVS